ncbi:TolC family protein [Lacihabitans lacunae]|uniref:TolC family protein n=1 Tax=Lacihabitans lacunae TaxID=1028214 RepID=A0ABV7YQU7_9BACT
MKKNIVLFLILSTSLSFAQKTLTLKEAEEELQKNNLLLLAEQYNIPIAEAAVIQAKIWELPYVSGEFNAINPQNKSVLSVGGKGQKGLAVQQLIYLGGKKKNEVAFAKSNIGIAQLQFEQLIRNLKYELAQTFYEVYYDNQKITAIENQLAKLETLYGYYEKQVSNGNIPLKEVVRLQSLILDLKNEKNALLTSTIEAQQTLALLTGVTETIVPSVNEIQLVSKFQNTEVSKDSILAYALQNNLDYLTAKKISESQELLLQWQRSLNTPDLTAGLAYDQRGGAFQNQINLTFGMPIPLWNKNKGNIKIVETQVKQTQANIEYKKFELETKVDAYWKLYVMNQNQLNSIQQSTTKNLEAVYDGVVSNFQKRNISMLEFTDFMESYNQTTLQINEIKKGWILASISLNYITNKEIF